MFGRAIINTWKQIRRSGWVAWSSIMVMTLAFFVASIFAGLAFLSNLYIQFIETRDNVLVFFEVGTEQQTIDDLQAKWKTLEQVREISFTSEETAYDLYLQETSISKPIEHQLLSEYDEKNLPSSLDIQLYSLDDINSVRNILLDDIDEALLGVEYDPSDPPIILRIDDETLDELREVFSAIRIGGSVILTLLFVIIFFFTLMTVEYRTYNRMEEIGVMQLVGGSLWYIRAPYILEGGFYGVMGALISTLVLAGIYIGIFVINPDSSLALFLRERLSILPLPEFTILLIGFIVSVKLLIGFLAGSMSSYLAIRRYIK